MINTSASVVKTQNTSESFTPIAESFDWNLKTTRNVPHTYLLILKIKTCSLLPYLFRSIKNLASHDISPASLRFLIDSNIFRMISKMLFIDET